MRIYPHGGMSAVHPLPYTRSPIPPTASAPQLQLRTFRPYPNVHLIVGVLRQCTLILAAGVVSLACGQPLSPELGHANLRELPAEILPEGVEVITIDHLPDGRMVWGTPEGVFIYDGHHTQRIPLPENLGPIRQAHATPDGRILIAAPNFAGVAKPAPDQSWHVTGWEDARSSITNFRSNFRLMESSGHLLVHNHNTLARWDGAEWIIEPDLPNDQTHYWDGGTALFRNNGNNRISRWQDGSWQEDRPLPPELPPNQFRIHEVADETLRFTDYNGGLFSLSIEGTLTTLNPPDHSDASVVDVAWYPDGASVIRFDDARLQIRDVFGQVTASLDERHRPAMGDLADISIDRNERIWASFRTNIASIDAPFHITRFDRSNGLDATQVLAIARYQSHLYVGTNDGVFRLEPGSRTDQSVAAQFRLVSGLRSRTPVLLEHEGKLFAGSADGVYSINSDTSTLEHATSSPVSNLHASPFDAETLYVGTSGGAFRLRRDSTGWIRPESFNHRNNVNSILEFEPNAWLINAGRNRLTLNVPHERQTTQAASTPTDEPSIDIVPMRVPLFGQFLQPQGLSLTGSRGQVFNDIGLARWGRSPVIVTSEGLYSTDAASVPLNLFDPATQAALKTDRELRHFVPHGSDRAWLALAPRRGDTRLGLGWQLREVSQSSDAPLQVLPVATTEVGAINTLLAESAEDGEILWVGGDQGLLRVRLDDIPVPRPPPAPFIHSVTGDSVTFHYAAPYLGTTPLVYRTRLKLGQIGEWTSYSFEPQRQLGFLEAGDYTFQVQARNAEGLTSEIREVHFTVPPPWWMQPWSLAAAAAIIALSAYAGFRWLSRRQRQHQQQLEVLVAERTTALRANEQQLSLAKEEAEEASRAKSTFLASMSHELRTPLNAIMGFSQLLQQTPTASPEQKRQLSTIHHSGEHLLQMINEMLDFAKIEAGRIELMRQPFSLTQLLGHLQEIFTLKAGEKNLAFSLAGETALPERIVEDESRLRQVLYNLLGNAVKFTPTGQVGLAVAVIKDRIRFIVTDTGPGIPVNQQKDIFTLFHRGNTPDPSVQGSGLGLTISQRLVTLMGGQIHVISSVGEGSQFQFDLPLTCGTGNAIATTMSPHPLGFEGPTKRIMIVDDEPVNRDLLQSLLSPLGFQLDLIKDGASAVAHVAAQPVDLILMDIRMPKLDGLSATTQIRQLPRGSDIRIIAISASVYPEDRTGAVSAGCDEFIGKPIDASVLCAHIGRLLKIDWQWPPGNQAPGSDREESDSIRADIGGADLRELQELAEDGDMMGLREHIALMQQQHPDALGWLEELERLASEAKLKDVRIRIESALRHPSQSRA